MSISTSETLKLFNECVRIGKEASKIEANLFSLAKESNTCMAIIIEAKDKELKQLNLIRELGLKGVYEYCGLVSLCLVPKDDDGYVPNTQGLAEAWCGRVAKGFEQRFSEFNKVGTFSNGESVYEKVV